MFKKVYGPRVVLVGMAQKEGIDGIQELEGGYRSRVGPYPGVDQDPTSFDFQKHTGRPLGGTAGDAGQPVHGVLGITHPSFSWKKTLCPGEGGADSTSNRSSVVPASSPSGETPKRNPSPL